MATHENITSRRALLLGLPAAALVAVAPATAARAAGNPDAELIALCERYAEAYRAQWEALAQNLPDAVIYGRCEEAGDLFHAIADLRAQTRGGRLAKARVALLNAHRGERDPEQVFQDFIGTVGVSCKAMAVSLLRDVLLVEGAAA
jgi:hypothetical protein